MYIYTQISVTKSHLLEIESQHGLSGQRVFERRHLSLAHSVFLGNSWVITEFSPKLAITNYTN